MVDAPETIGLVAGPFGLRLWNREEDDSEAGVIRYLRADIAERQIAEARARHSGELQRASSLYEQAVAVEARAEDISRQLAEARAATEKMHHRAQVAEGKIQSARAAATEQIEVLASAAKQLGHWPAGSHWAKRAMERWIKATDVATEAERDRLAAEVERLREALKEHVTENVWNAYHIGIERDGRWMDGARSEGEWLAGELELPAGWNDAALVKSMLPGLVDRIVASAALASVKE